MHQIIVALDGWKKVSPVSIDKIGIYFREAMPEVDVTTAVVSCVCASAKFVLVVQHALHAAHKLFAVRYCACVRAAAT